MELRRQVIIRELQQKGFHESRDGRDLNQLTLQELEVELVRLPEVAELEVQHG